MKYTATAIRAEKCLRDHMGVLYGQRKHMARVMREAEAFGKGTQRNLARKDQEMMQADFEATRDERLAQLKAAGDNARKVSDNLKYGRGRKDLARLFK